MRRAVLVSVILFALLGLGVARAGRREDPRLRGARRNLDRNGWIQVHLEGDPERIGFQHGYLLAPEIQDAFEAVRLELTHTEQRDWASFRDLAREVLWPKVDPEYRQELEGLVAGLRARGGRLDLWDLVAFNGSLELPYLLAAEKPGRDPRPPAERCSAFVATGSWTRDGGVVMAHNNWSGYLSGGRWNIVFDVVPAAGHAFVMDGMPGFIHSGDDFGINAAGLMITETTIGAFTGFDRAGIPEFVRARKAMQYAGSIDAFAAIMKAGNNGGYANDWLLADRRTGEIASLELGLKHVTLQRSKDGCFVGANFPKNPDLIREETRFDPANPGLSGNARKARWETLMAQHRGRIDLAAAKAFMADHRDSAEGREDPDERSLCGHIDRSPRGASGWMPAFGLAGTVQSKVSDARLAAHRAFEGAIGHPCGLAFNAAEHLTAHPEFEWQRPLLRDLPARPWTRFEARR